ncbi:MAG: hypothetical protein ACRCT1_21515 [Microcoleaceae cyanobacterium]
MIVNSTFRSYLSPIAQITKSPIAPLFRAKSAIASLFRAKS